MTISKFILNDPCISNHGAVKHCNQLSCKDEFWNSWSGLIGTFYYKANETHVVVFD